MKGFKGFNPDFTCRGKQYEENKIFEEETAEICESGMHFCENPFEVLRYYDLVNKNGKINEFAEVEALDEAFTDDNKKFCTKKLKIGAKLGLKGFVKACVDFTIEKTSFEFPDSNIDSGNSAKIGSSGYSAKIGSSGYSAQIGSSGGSAKIGSSGDYARIDSSGKHSVVMCAGYNSMAKAKIGSWITLAEWKKNSDGKWIPVCVKTEQVDGERIKEDTFYKLEDGEFKEYE
nr:MAG TPA: hypothetical protein [Caudoviricetes sp.]